MTASVAGANAFPGRRGLTLSARRRAGRQEHPSCLSAVDALLADRFDGEPGAGAVLDTARLRAYSAFDAAGADEAADRLAASLFAGEAIAGLAVEQLLRPADVRDLAFELTESSGHGTLAAGLVELYLRAASTPLLLSLPPLFAVETAMRLLVTFGLVNEISLWSRPSRALECLVSLGDEEPSRRTRAAARWALGGNSGVNASRRAQIHSAAVLRFGRPDAALVARVVPETRAAASAFLAEAAASLSPLLERAMLLDSSAERERQLVKGAERRLTTLGFDLHDGPIQDVLALAGDVSRLRDEMHPFVVEPHREKAIAELDDMHRRLVDIDRELRELAHSLESSSAVNRPIEEVLHREVETFAERTGIATRVDIVGNAFLTASQRMALFRAVQEALTNAREHSGASRIEVSLRCRRSWTELRVADDGCGFSVEHGVASAAKRGRLGLIGISERVRMLGGTFRIDSAPGGPTVLFISLPRWEPLETSTAAT